MWKNVFLESCIPSALIFEGSYLNATLLQDELYSNDNKNSLDHISGLATLYNPEMHISSQILETEFSPHISGLVTPAKTQP